MAKDESLEMAWLHDLCGPKAPGKYFSRQGYRVIVSDSDFRAAQFALAKGASDVLFGARRADGHYVLATIVEIKQY
jgi:hypothetical protein